jgi:hypothetical protein
VMFGIITQVRRARDATRRRSRISWLRLFHN